MRKSRAVVMGTNAHPFLMAYWLYLFNKFWVDEVDKVYICISTPIYPMAWGYTKTMLESNPKIQVIETNGGWPKSVEIGIEKVTEESMLICHDDLFVFKKGVMEEMFSIVENEGKIVTPVHGNYTPTFLIRELMQKKWGDILPFTAPDGSTEYSFFCNFTFGPTELIKRSGYNLDGYQVKIGDTCELLNWQFLTTELHADTNFYFGLQLLEAGASFRIIPEYDFKAMIPLPYPVLEAMNKQKKEKTGVYADLPWLHFQTFSYHISGLMFDLGYREMLETTSGGKVLPLIHAQAPVMEIVGHNDILLKIATLQVMESVRDLSGMQRWVDHANEQLEYVRKYVGITKKELNKVKKHLLRILKIDEKN